MPRTHCCTALRVCNSACFEFLICCLYWCSWEHLFCALPVEKAFRGGIFPHKRWRHNFVNDKRPTFPTLFWEEAKWLRYFSWETKHYHNALQSRKMTKVVNPKSVPEPRSVPDACWCSFLWCRPLPRPQKSGHATHAYPFSNGTRVRTTLWGGHSVVMFGFVFVWKFRLPIGLHNSCSIIPTASETHLKCSTKYQD